MERVRALWPMLSACVRDAPRLISIWAVFSWPYLALKCNGVVLFLSTGSMGASAWEDKKEKEERTSIYSGLCLFLTLSSNLTHLAWPYAAAQSSGVHR